MRPITQIQTTLHALCAGVEDSLLQLEEFADADDQGGLAYPILLRRRRAAVALHAYMRSAGLERAGSRRSGGAGVVRPTIYSLIQSERALLGLYEAARSETSETSPAGRLLAQQTAESRSAIVELASVVVGWRSAAE